jgi:hypothetical protein
VGPLGRGDDERSEEVEEEIVHRDGDLVFRDDGGEAARCPLPVREMTLTTEGLLEEPAIGRELGLTLPIGLLPLLDALRSRSAIPIAVPGVRTAERPRTGIPADGLRCSEDAEDRIPVV